MKKSKWIACAVFLAMMSVFVQSIAAENCTLQVTLNSSYPGLASVKGAKVTVTYLLNGVQKTDVKELSPGTTAFPLPDNCGRKIEGTVFSRRGLDGMPKAYRIVPIEVRDPSGTACLPCLLQIERSDPAGDFKFVRR